MSSSMIWCGNGPSLLLVIMAGVRALYSRTRERAYICWCWLKYVGRQLGRASN